MSSRRTRSGGASQSSESKTASPKPVRKSQRKSGSDFPKVLPEIWQKAPQTAPVRKPIVLKKIVAHAVEIPGAPLTRRSPRIAFFLEKENNPPYQETTKEDLFNPVPMTPNTTPVLTISSVHQQELDARDMEMSKKVRRSYSRLQTPGSTSTPGCGSCFGFDSLEDLSGVSPVVCSKITDISKAPAKLLIPDPTLPGISPPVVKEKRKKKKVPEILSSSDSRRVHSGQDVQPVEQKSEEFQASKESDEEPPFEDQMPDLQSAPTVRFLFTLLNTPETKDSESDSDTQDNQFLDQDDWGPKQTSKEMRELQHECMRLLDAVSITQMENLALKEKLQSLSTTLYQSMKEEVLAFQEEAKMALEETDNDDSGDDGDDDDDNDNDDDDDDDDDDYSDR
ncbi:sororin-like isoform X1 [Dipodomys merriami]|uniref:sororin-like isoform X1 n=1 Tax=Dipodomys merriami TaxID=94247 RepID=UPI003850662B